MKGLGVIGTRLVPHIRGLWFAAICLVGTLAVYLWASGRGYDIRDEATYLLWVDVPFTYKSSSTDFAIFWHPLYLAAGGNIVSYRVLGMLVLTACAVLFSLALNRFLSQHISLHGDRMAVILAVVSAVFWEFSFWLPTPNYNELTLCTQLLFFAGLLFSSSPQRCADEPRMSVVAPSALAGLALVVLILTKPPSAMVVIVLGLAWLVMTPPRRLWLSLVTMTGVTVLVLIGLIILFYGGFGEFVHSKTSAMMYLKLLGHGLGESGILGSITKPLQASQRWKAIGTAEYSALVLLLCGASFAVRLVPGRLRVLPRGILGLVLALLLGGIVLFFRAWDIAAFPPIPELHAWHYAIFMMPITMGLIALGLRKSTISTQFGRSCLKAAGVLAAVPLAYSFGTDNPLVLHMTDASVFWVASGVLIAAALPRQTQRIAYRTIATNVGAVTLGLTLGVTASPGFGRAPLWGEVVPTSLGPNGCMLDLRSQDATYFKAIRQKAYAGGFVSRTPVIDVSGMGPGLVYAIGGSAPGFAWLTYTEKPSTKTFALEVLRSQPKEILRRSWVITTANDPVKFAEILPKVGLSFPAGYVAVAYAGRSDSPIRQTLWKPVNWTAGTASP